MQTTNQLAIEISYPQPIEIVIEFPLAVLGQYRGISKLDETWDDDILPIITNAITQADATIQKSALLLGSANLCYTVTIIATPPTLNLNTIVNHLSAGNFNNGLTISRLFHHKKEILFVDESG